MRLLILLLGAAMCQAFPREGSPKYAYIVASTAGNLPSAARDALTHGVLWSRRGFQLRYYLDFSLQEYVTLQRNLQQRGLSATFGEMQLLTQDLSREEGADIILTISAHGYQQPYHHIVFKGKRLEPRHWLNGYHQHPTIKVMAVIDTCHSGPMMGLTRQDGSICSLAACRAEQSVMDDLSTEFGFGGGLTSCLADVLGINPSLDVQTILTRCQARMACTGAQPHLTWG